jgi:hypothetical protein
MKGLALRNGHLLFELSLCLSRACLGKMIVSIYKLLKKTVFTHRALSNANALREFSRLKIPFGMHD